MAKDGSVNISVNMETDQAERDLAELKGEIESIKKKIAADEGSRDSIKAEAQTAKDEALQIEKRIESLQGKLATLRETAAMAGIKKPMGEAELVSEIKEQEGLLKEQDKLVEKLYSDYDKVSAQIESGKVKLEGMTVQAGEMQAAINRANSPISRMGSALETAGKKMDKFTARVKRLVSRVFVFTLITTALRSMRSWMGKVISSNDEAAAAISKLKAALLTLVQPLVDVVVPAFTSLVDILARLATVAARIVSSLFGTTLEDSARAAEALSASADAVEEVGSSAKKSGKETEKFLAGFDEIQKIGGSSSGSASAAGAAETSSKAPDFESVINSPLDTILEFFSGSALLALGAILTFSGANIPLGLALMATGAAFIYDSVSEDWGGIEEKLQGPIGRVFAAVSFASLVLGAILTFSGANLPLGIALMALGAAGLATAVVPNWEKIVDLLQGPVGKIFAAVSGSLLVLGAMFAFSGTNIPLGIGLMIAGAAGLAADAAVNWETIVDAVKGPLGLIFAAVSVALLVLGALFTFSGANIPLGIGLMIAGAAGIAAVIVPNWDTIVNALQGPIGLITAIVSGILLVLGIILLFSGAGIPLGLGLLAAGAVGLAVAIAPNWDFLMDKLKETWGKIQNWWDTKVHKYFTWEYWSGLAKDMVDGLVAGLGAVWQKIGDWGSELMENVKDIFGIHSPSTEFEGLGDYMMAGLYNGILSGSPAVTEAFRLLFASVLSMCTGNTDMMRACFAALLVYLATDYAGEWGSLWASFYSSVSSSLSRATAEVEAFKRALASIERRITVTVTTAYTSTGAPQSGTVPAGGAASRIGYLNALNIGPVPALARGTVIPPNREFLAVLGDQNTGTNVEAPLSVIEQAVENALNRSGYRQGGDTTVILEVDGQVFGKVTYSAYNREKQRVGVRLVEA